MQYWQDAFVVCEVILATILFLMVVLSQSHSKTELVGMSSVGVKKY